MTPIRLRGPVVIMGAGLVGTSVGLALRGHDIAVCLVDPDDDNLREAVSRGAGAGTAAADPELVVVAVPPRSIGGALVDALQRWPRAVVTDVGSVKVLPFAQVEASGADLSRYVGSHPMAGSERSGPGAASATLFTGRSWAVSASDRSLPHAVALVHSLVGLCGASAVELTPSDHDSAVAHVSHLPHVIAALVAGQLAVVSDRALSLAGPGLRDVTRIAAGDPDLWCQILTGNARQLYGPLHALRHDLDQLLDALSAGDAAVVEELLLRGQQGTERIPGKHGGTVSTAVGLLVQVADRPGELGRLFADAGASGVNVEDLRIDHDPSRPVGRVEVVVRRDAADHLAGWLTDAGWLVQR